MILGTQPGRFSLASNAWKKREEKAEIDSLKEAERPFASLVE